MQRRPAGNRRRYRGRLDLDRAHPVELEDAINIGFGIPVGDVNEMFRAYVEYINEECGGIRGRQVRSS